MADTSEPPTGQERYNTPEPPWLAKARERCPAVIAPGFWETLEQNCEQWARDASVCEFWTKASSLIPGWAKEFRAATGADLVPNPGLPSFGPKKLPRLKSKIFIGSKSRFDSYWPSPTTQIPILDDYVRTRLQCNHLDGVPFVSKKLFELAAELKLEPALKLRGLLGGYFAQHIYFTHDTYFKFGGSKAPVRISCEVQVGTTLATVVWDVSHKVYELDREQNEDASAWQWNPDDPRFLKGQLGHMIHLADGILVNLRKAAAQERRK